MPWLALAILLFFTYAKFFGHPYGFRWDAATGLITHVFRQQPEPTLKVGDRILQIGDVTWQQFESDLLTTFFDGVQPGDTVPILLDRAGRSVEIDWVYPPGPAREEFLDQLISEWFFAYFFWIAGLLTVLDVRPKDETWLLMALFNFLTAIWLIAGSGVSAFHVWGSELVLRAAVLLCVPVYLHLHWLFPQPLSKLSPLLVRSIYLVALLLAIAQAFQLLSDDFFFVGFLIALGGSLILLLIHLIRQPSARRSLRLVFTSVVLALVLAIVWGVAYSLNKIPVWMGGAGLLGLPLLPLAYLYAAFRRRLGTLEVRASRFFSIYFFVILLAILELPFIIFFGQVFNISAEVSAISLLSAALTAAAFIWGYPVFERFVDVYILGIPLTSKRLLESFSTHIATSLSLADLIRVLQEEVLPSLLIRQFAFLQYDQGSLNVLSTIGLHDEPLAGGKDVEYLMEQSGKYRSPDITEGEPSFPWLLLILPLRLGNQLHGFWLLGRRDPDDLYPQRDILTLSSLANLTAIALSNILQTERLTSMYQANINRYEEERVSLARDLHDSILNELAALPIRSDAPVFSPKFQEAYDGVSDHLREVIGDLRPSMLSFGLKLALEAYVEHLRERNLESVEIQIDLQADDECRYPLMIEANIYRIVQEACENTLRYAHAKHLSITGELTEKQIELRVTDDGVGLDPNTSLNFNDLLTHKHFGLAGMHERASVIRADLNITSQPNQGTQIHLLWKANETI